MKKFVEIVLIVLCVFIISGCSNKKVISDDKKFKDEYSNIDIDSDNNIKYSDIDNVMDIVDSGSGVIYIGNNENELCNVIVPVLLNASSNTDLDKIYYVNSNNIEDEFEIKDKDGNIIIDNNNMNIPLVLFIYDGNVMSYHIGSIDDKNELSEDDTIKLYNIYLEGIHSVLNDQCDSDNNGEEHC